MNKKVKRLLILPLILVLLLGLTALRDYLQGKDDEAEKTSTRQYAPFVEETDPLYQYYVAAHPEKEIILACVGDLTDDGLNELVVIYRAGSDGSCETVALVQEGGSYYETTPTPAPREYQKMRFFNMDKKDEQELLITGSKDGEVGYAIYRIIDGELVNFFGEGMEDCC